MTKKYAELDAAGICFHEFEYMAAEAPQSVPAGLMDVTARTDGPWLGKIYDAQTDTFAWPEPTAKLTASAARIAQGEKVTLTWRTTDALSAEITNVNAGGALVHRCEPPGAGVVEVEPGQTFTYELTATGRAGTTPAKARRRVTVI